MNASSQASITQLLDELQGGNREVLGELFPKVYKELHAGARRERQRWQGDYTLNTTALVHEAYLKLVDQEQAAWENRAHFLGVAAKAMRHILMDYAKARQAQKRGGDVPKLSLEEMKVGEEIVLTEERAEVLMALEEALKKLEAVNEREAQVVECRYFGQMTVEETAVALGISPRTVKRDWAMARTWLYKTMVELGH